MLNGVMLQWCHSGVAVVVHLCYLSNSGGTPLTQVVADLSRVQLGRLKQEYTSMVDSAGGNTMV
jgi:hypothetical protein